MVSHGTARAYASDIQLILQRSKVSKDSRIKLPFLISRIHDWRAKEIRDQWKRAGNDDVNPEWIQDMGTCSFTQIKSSDDPIVPVGCTHLGKLTIPQVVSLPNDRGVFRVSPVDKFDPYYPIEVDRFYGIVPGSVASKFKYFFRIGTSLYISPYKEDVNLLLLLLNPLDGYVILTENIQSGNLIFTNDFQSGAIYKVIEGAIVHNGVTYIQNQTFQAVNPDYTGNGIVQFLNQKRKMTIDDPYPMSGDLAIAVAMKIWTNDFELERKEIADIVNDAQDQMVALQPE